MKRRKRKRGELIRQHLKSGIWYLDCMDPAGTDRIQRSLHTRNRHDAEMAARAWWKHRYDIAYGGIKDVPERTLGELMDEFRRHIEAHPKMAPKTATNYFVTLRAFERFADVDTPGWRARPLTTLEPQMFDRYREARMSEGRKGSTVNQGLARLSAMFRFAVKQGYLSNNPIRRVERADVKPKQPRWLTSNEIDRMRKMLTGDLLDFFEVAIATGLRLSEMLNLRWDRSIGFEQNVITVWSSETWKPKSASSHRSVPMRKEVRAIMERRYQERSSGPFVFNGDEAWNKRFVQREFTESYKKAGIKGANIHSLRHTFATHFRMSGGDITNLRDLLGHSSVKVTEVYAHANITHLESALDKMSFDTARPHVLKREEIVKVRKPRSVSARNEKD